MLESEARVNTTFAARYVAQLCKHFAHRLTVTHEGDSGMIAFEAGRCMLKAEGDTLIMRCQASEAPLLERLQNVLDRHLERFAFRDKPQIAWRATAETRETFFA